MKIPLCPPPVTSVVRNLSAEEMVDLVDLRSPLVDGEYIHWDRLRRRTPPAGRKLDHWWAGLKLARMGLLQPLPLLDKDAAHALCKDCHSKKGAGPTKCGECHKK